MTMLTSKQLAQRWNLAEITLRTWRVDNKGPKFIKIGRNVRYKIEDVEEFENKSN